MAFLISKNWDNHLKQLIHYSMEVKLGQKVSEGLCVTLEH
jgi:hypothetical protein